MKFVKDLTSFLFEEKKSKFIAFLMPYENFKKTMQELKIKHPKARHFVYAYRYLNEHEQIVENSSDDGEPRGTSGKPSLCVLSGANIINSAVIIIRYFGGVKLGTGGLVRAYSDSVNEVINISSFSEYKKLEIVTLTCSYAELTKLEYLLKKENIKINSKEFLDYVKVNISLSNQEWELFSKKLPQTIKKQK